MIFSTYSYGFPGFNNHNTLHSSIFTEKNHENSYIPNQIQFNDYQSDYILSNNMFSFPENPSQDEDKLIVGDIDDIIISHNGSPISGENNHFLELKEEKMIKIGNHSSENIKCSKYEKNEKEISQMIIENDEKEISQIIIENDEKEISHNNFHKIFIVENLGRRRYDPDDMRKKIKTDFFQRLENNLNNELKSQNYKKEFKFPRCFVYDINKKRNKEFINYTIKELLTKDLYSDLKKNKEKSETTKNDNNIRKVIGEDVDDKSTKIKIDKDDMKINTNSEIITYLKKNEDLRRKINFDSLEKKTFAELFNEYLESGFKDTMSKLKKKKESYYVNEYEIIAKEFIKYYSE